MKTTFDIADNILTQSRRLAKMEHIPLKELVEEGLQLVLRQHASSVKRPVEPVTFRGNGMSTAFRGRGWADIRDAAYEGRGA